MNTSEVKAFISSGKIDDILLKQCVLSPDEVRGKYIDAADLFTEIFGEKDNIHLFSVGGRSEVSGNHTDHNNGRVLAAAVNLEIAAVACVRDDGTVNVKSEGFPMDTVLPSEIKEPRKDRFFTSAAIIAGMQKAFLDNGYKAGGFDAYTVSNVLKGSGLSSSAAFEVMIGNIINHLYNGSKVDNVSIAKMAQYAENVYFGKPSGLMDQTACAVGGFISIDFKDPWNPAIEKIDFDLSDAGYSLCIINTGGNHADLNEDYASVPAEMKAVAHILGKNVLRECDPDEIIKRVPEIREKAGDRALLRSLHFICENERVVMQAEALRCGDIDAFFSGVIASGNSSYKYLQNVYTIKNPSEQGLSLALCLCELYLSGKKAAWRVHGGGFAGTVQVFVPTEECDGFVKYMENVFGAGSCYMLSIRKAGAICLL